MFPTAIIITPESGFPVDDADDFTQREYCRALLAGAALLPDAVFGSENYLPGFAAHLKAEYVMVDLNRIKYPISGTALRNGSKELADWTSPIVGAATGKRILFIGAESSGKTTIVEACANKFHSTSTWVPEFGRELWDKRDGKLQYADMLHIARTQVTQEETAMMNYPTGYVFCDTSPLVTQFYSNYLFDKVDAQLEILAQRQYDHIFVCARDIPYVDDGTRNGIEFGAAQEQYYLTRIEGYTVLTGSVSQRTEQVIKCLKDLTFNKTEAIINT